MSFSFSGSYDVRASCRAGPSRLYALLLDGATWPRWSGIDSSEVEQVGASNDPEALAYSDSESPPVWHGEAIRVFRTGRNVSRERIVELVKDCRLVYEMLTDAGGLLRGYREQIDLDPTSGGGTLIRWRATWHTPVPVVGWLMQRYRRGFQQEMVNGLAQYAERDQTGADAA